jgi:D-alanyl-D-alanine carboxypeptidase
MGIAPKTERVRRLRRTPVLTATAAVASIVLLLKPVSASGLSSMDEPQAASDQARLSALAPTHTERLRAAPLSSRTARLRRIVHGLVAAGAPGAIAVVRTPTRIRRAAAGFADVQTRVRMQATDRFRIASVTKTFVATVVLQLEAEGRLDIDDSVERWLPGLVPNGSSITLRELLNHTSGLFSFTDDEAVTTALIADPGRQWSPGEVLSIAFSHPSLYEPGTAWSYSNTNYVLLGHAIEAATGSTLEQELQERILSPLALGATSSPAGTAIEGRFAHGYIGPHPGLPIPRGNLLDISLILNPSYAWAAGNMVSSAPDLTRFFAALPQGRLLPAAQLAEMKTGSTANRDYGLGLKMTYTACGAAIGHEGDFPGYRNAVWATPNGRRVAVAMVNIDTTRVSWSRLRTAAQTALCFG